MRSAGISKCLQGKVYSEKQERKKQQCRTGKQRNCGRTQAMTPTPVLCKGAQVPTGRAGPSIPLEAKHL